MFLLTFFAFYSIEFGSIWFKPVLSSSIHSILCNFIQFYSTFRLFPLFFPQNIKEFGTKIQWIIHWDSKHEDALSNQPYFLCLYESEDYVRSKNSQLSNGTSNNFIWLFKKMGKNLKNFHGIQLSQSHLWYHFNNSGRWLFFFSNISNLSRIFRIYLRSFSL